MHSRSAPPLLLSLAVGCGLTACAAPPPGAPRPDSPPQEELRDEIRYGSVIVDIVREDQTTIGATPLPADRLWPYLIEVVLDLGFETDDLKVYDPASRQVAVSRRPVRRLGGARMSRLLDCGRSVTGPRADTHQIEVRLTAWLEPVDRGSLVRTRLEAAARRRGLGAVGACRSRGKLEIMLVDELHRRALADDPEHAGAAAR